MFKPGDEEYKKFRHHTHEQHFITKREVKQFKQGSQYNNRGSPTITEVQQSLTHITGKKHLNSIFIFLILSHRSEVLYYISFPIFYPLKIRSEFVRI